MRLPKLSPTQKEWVRNNSANLSIREIADKFEVGRSGVSYFLEHNRLPYKKDLSKHNPVEYKLDFNCCPITGFKGMGWNY
jgi:hypothetical protein